MDTPLGYTIAGLSLLDAGLTGILLAIYGRSFTRTQAPFLLGLIIFASAFLAQSLIVAWMYLAYMEMVPPRLVDPLLASMIAETGGLVAMAGTALV